MVPSPLFSPAACYMFSSCSIRLSVDGCVAHIFLFFFCFLRFLPNGLLIYFDAVASFSSLIFFCITLIFHRELFKPIGLLLNLYYIAYYRCYVMLIIVSCT